MKKVIALAVLLFLGWVFATPWLTLLSIRSAIQERKSAELAQYIDFPALKQSLKAGLSAQANKSISGLHGNDPTANALGAAATQFMSRALDPMLDALLTPEAISEILRKRSEGNTADHPEASDKGTPSFSPSSFLPKGAIEIAIVGYTSFDTFAVALKRKGGSDNEQIVVILRRHGLASWKASGVALGVASGQ
jgi:hypothetical protein